MIVARQTHTYGFLLNLIKFLEYIYIINIYIYFFLQVKQYASFIRGSEHSRVIWRFWVISDTVNFESDGPQVPTAVPIILDYTVEIILL
jgi:hypothetical protein